MLCKICEFIQYLKFPVVKLPFLVDLYTYLLSSKRGISLERVLLGDFNLVVRLYAAFFVVAILLSFVDFHQE